MTVYTTSQLAGRREAMARWRDRNRTLLNAQRTTDRALRRAEVSRLKEAAPCTDCGGYFSAVCMDYDHTGTDKTANVARLVADGPMSRILAEIAKCELVCANCHRIRTHARRSEHHSPVSQTS